MRVDAWPDKPGHIWGSHPEMLRRQLLDEYDIDYAILEVLWGQDGYDHPDFAREWNHAINQWQAETWLEFDPRLRATIAVAHEYPDLAVAQVRGGEIILCGGAINPPQLLQLSGVGSAGFLRVLGIHVVADLPGVGENLQDHLEVYVQYGSKLPVSVAPALKMRNRPMVGAKWLLLRRGP